MPFSVRFQPSGASVQVAARESLHAAVRRAGLPIASACGADGICGRCGLEILDGGERLTPEDAVERRAKQRNRVDTGVRLACRTRVLGDVEVRASYW